MPFKDLRSFIPRLEEFGEAQRIKGEFDWKLEVGAILGRCHELGLPAPFFQKIMGYPEGYRSFGGTLSKSSRIAIAMDLPPNISV